MVISSQLAIIPTPFVPERNLQRNFVNKFELKLSKLFRETVHDASLHATALLPSCFVAGVVFEFSRRQLIEMTVNSTEQLPLPPDLERTGEIC